MNKNLKFGMSLALITAVISGFANFIAKIGVTSVKNPVVFTTLKNSIVAVLLIGLVLSLGKIKELKALSKKSWVKLLAIGVIGGSVPFILFFTGLSMTSALTASFIHKTLFVWVAILAVWFLKEKVTKLQIGALVLLLGGTLLLGGFQNFHFGKGEIMILAATLLWAVENIIAKKALAEVSSLTLASARMVFGSIILLAVVVWQGKIGLMAGLSPKQWLWTLIPAVLLFGYVLTWYTALKHAPATVVASLLVPAVFITTVLSTIFLKTPLTSLNNLSGVLFAVAAVLLVINYKIAKNNKSNVESAKSLA
ncbi:MAG: hypothetical protein COT26_02270 [Candidatus Kerfeldbacteria bacterium CG08_land_8_20_14_0_20_43_14]|uniref:EamA domain-containing protein n=1 Tax=Candidatus Kerfeldbacteria bacterium CG08_land_8_20_14_0_20_43_14 TaxID=2014246 RepID=A0A2H0YQ54_9BACT|nr:MAG: hypothetical protein COT26_02270 [Candidatus Kerfeldbacteria bacterium CG08_land_8_20_14_0_20_43_14]